MKAEAKVRYYCNSSTVAELPCEIFFNIFLKLPVKPLLLCKCVCKSWRQLLSDPYFAKLHMINQPQSQKVLLRSYNDSFYSLDCESTHGNAVLRKFPLKVSPPVDVLSSCNGLLCVAVPHESQESPHRQLVEVVLWNPTTGDYKTLPSAKPSVDRRQVVGFGYHPSLDDYMMVRIITHDFIIDSEEKFRRIEGEHRVDMYSLRTNSWKRIQDSPGHGFITKAGSYGANGSIYWGGQYCTVIRFDLKGEKFSVFPMPNDIEGGVPRCVLTRGGCLWLYYTVQLPQCNNIVLWTMKEDENKKEQWTKLMTISSPREKIDRGRAIGPTCFLENGKLLLYKAKRTSKDHDFERSLVIKFVVYDPKKNSIPETFPIYGISGFWMWETYTESFVSPNST